MLDQLGANLGHFAANLAPTWANLGQLGANLGQLGANFARLCPSLGQLGANLSQLEPKLGQLGANLGLIWPFLCSTSPSLGFGYPACEHLLEKMPSACGLVLLLVECFLYLLNVSTACGMLLFDCLFNSLRLMFYVSKFPGSAAQAVRPLQSMRKARRNSLRITEKINEKSQWETQ